MSLRALCLPLFVALTSTLVLAGCGKDAASELCLQDFEKFEAAVKGKDDAARKLAGGVYQSCGISCDVTKDEETCGAFARVTAVICEQEGKEACEDLCNKGRGNEEHPEKNEHACAALAAMQ